uniref:Putative serine/threonine-protein kinase n=1 Tax=Aegilops tauschii TaxID=37682 RepID=M8B3G4_AEGTA
MATQGQKTTHKGPRDSQLTSTRTRRASANIPVTQILAISKEIKEVRVEQVPASDFGAHDGVLLTIQDKPSDRESDKVMVHLGVRKSRHGDESHSGSFRYMDKDVGFQSAEEGGPRTFRQASTHGITSPSTLVGLLEFSYLFWVYRSEIINGTPVAVKKLLYNLGQAEKEFRVEVEAIGHVRHKNLVRLLGYCVEGTQRYLYRLSLSYSCYTFVIIDCMSHSQKKRAMASWRYESPGLPYMGGPHKDSSRDRHAYLHEAIELKVVHHDIKSSTILIDGDFDAKVSDFGLAKLLGAVMWHQNMQTLDCE